MNPERCKETKIERLSYSWIDDGDDGDICINGRVGRLAECDSAALDFSRK